MFKIYLGHVGIWAVFIILSVLFDKITLGKNKFWSIVIFSFLFAIPSFMAHWLLLK